MNLDLTVLPNKFVFKATKTSSVKPDVSACGNLRPCARSALEVMPPIVLCWSATSEVDGGMAVRLNLSTGTPLHFVAM